MIQTIANKIEEMLEDEAPIKIEQGQVFKSGINPQLDEWREISSGGKKWILDYQEKLIQETGIMTLKIKFNKVFGYFIEVSMGQKNNVPDYFIRKQTLTNAERFSTEELTNYQEKILKAADEILAIEYNMFETLCEEILQDTSVLQDIADEIADIDCLSSFAELAKEKKYCQPEICEENILEIKEGRHPVVENLCQHFIANDLYLDQNTNFLLLSGPNMAGKSTYLRQNALIIYLTHIGCFVPATSAKIGLVDRIFTRVGAGDDLSAGESTFMIEMLEASAILHNATEKSFVILDELGRGTSTFDGLSLAWAMSEYIHDTLKAKCIFATHYHELIRAIDTMKRAKNISVAVLENEKQGVVFLHKIIQGGADKSYGIEVAKLAGVPQDILQRAQVLLENLENKKQQQEKALQMNLFDEPLVKSKKPVLLKKSIVETEIQEMNIDTLSPLEALQFLHDLQKKLL